MNLIATQFSILKIDFDHFTVKSISQPLEGN